jgi:hypothetical protein
MNALKRILNKQTWIQELKQMKLAVKAVELYAAKYIPSHIKQEMRIAAAQGQVPYFDIVCSNRAYEIAMIATTPGKLDVGGMWISLIGLPATRVGCTSFGYWGGNDDSGLGLNVAVLFARNLDWPDPDGLLKRYTRMKTYKARRKPSFWSLEKPLEPFHSLTFPGYSGVLTGYAPGRFAVSLNAVMNDTELSFGAAPSLLTRQALETCGTFVDAVKLLCRTPLVCGALFTVIDASRCSGKNAGCVVERSPKGYAIRHAVPVGENDWVVCATNDYHAIKAADVSDLPSEMAAGSGIAQTSCNRYNKVINGLRNARLGLPDEAMLYDKDVRRILKDTEFGCTVHSTVFDVQEEPHLPWE